jgi:hypothetical protein
MKIRNYKKRIVESHKKGEVLQLMRIYIKETNNLFDQKGKTINLHTILGEEKFASKSKSKV